MNEEWQRQAKLEVESLDRDEFPKSDEETLKSQRILVRADVDRFLHRGGIDLLDMDGLQKLHDVIHYGLRFS